MADATFKQRYIDACRDVGVEPVGCIEKVEVLGDKLCVSSQTLAVKGSVALGVALKGAEFREVELSNSYINDDGCRAICEGLVGNEHLRVLNLAGNNFGGNSADALADVVRSCENLQEVVLEWNNLGLSSAPLTLLCDALGGSKSLRKLDLRNNRISPEGVGCIAKLLAFTETIESLDLRWNRLGVRSGDPILSALGKNKSVTELYLTGNDIDYTTLLDIEERVAVTSKIRVDVGESERLKVQQKEFEATVSQNAERLQLEVQRRESHIVEERRRISQLEVENDSLRSMQSRLKADAESSRDELTHLTKGITEKVTTLRDENTLEITSIKAECKSQIAEMTQTISELNKENSTLNQTVARIESENTTLHTKLTSETERVNELAQQLASLREQHNELEFKSSQDGILLKRTGDELDAKTQGHAMLLARKCELEEIVLSLEREKNTLTGDLQRAGLEKERAVQVVRDEVERDKQNEIERAARRVREAVGEVAAKEKILAELKVEAGKEAERQRGVVDEIEERVKASRESQSALEIDNHKLSSLVSQLQSEKKRMAHDIQVATDRHTSLTQELETAHRHHQDDIDRLTERFASDRLDLEKKLLQREERVSHLDEENSDLSQKLKRLADDFSREKDRLQRRVTEQIRVIFEERT